MVETIQAKKADKKGKKEKEESAVIDPLSGGSKQEIIDPLSQAASDPLSQAASDPLSAVLTESVKPLLSFGGPVSRVRLVPIPIACFNERGWVGVSYFRKRTVT